MLREYSRTKSESLAQIRTTSIFSKGLFYWRTLHVVFVCCLFSSGVTNSATFDKPKGHLIIPFHLFITTTELLS